MNHQGYINKPDTFSRKSKCYEDGYKWEKLLYRKISSHQHQIFIYKGSGVQRKAQNHVLSGTPCVSVLLHKKLQGDLFNKFGDVIMEIVSP